MNNYTFRSLTDQELRELRQQLPISVKARRSTKNLTKGKIILTPVVSNYSLEESKGSHALTPVQSNWTPEEFNELIAFLDSQKLGLERLNPCILVSEYTELQSGIDGLVHYELTDTSELQQLKYFPKSKGNSLASLVSPKLKDAIADSLDQLQHQVGNIDRYVSKNLGYSQKELYHYFSAEQIDALALFLLNVEREKGFILGDQTGVGKGRVVAGAIKYALKSGLTPIFVTDNPMLYADIMRDLWNIGIGASFRPFVTNTNLSITLPNGDLLESDPDLEQRLASRDLSGYNAIFTTYHQLSTVKGKWTDRHEFLNYFATGSIICFDESHQAGVSVDPKTCSARGFFARDLANKAAGVLYSSATFAKNPDSLIFYSRTDILDGIGDYESFVDLIRSNGVAIQQALASELARAGQYIRREKSYEGIEFNTVVEEVDRQTYNEICGILSNILDFDEYYKKPALEHIEARIKRQAKKIEQDGSIGDAGASSTNFVSIMHNLVDQMLFSMKADAAIAQALKSVENGEKPVITLANTMGSAIERYASDMGLEAGDSMKISFADLLLRYLVRSREILISDHTGTITKEFMSEFDVGEDGLELWEKTRKRILALDTKKLPVSPIDYIAYRLRSSGMKVAEITGRQHIAVYGDNRITYQVRSTKERGKNMAVKTIADFNNGKLDCLIINRSGSTGVSMHSSVEVEDQRPRRMILLQPERDINVFMQILGRINRTGQVNLPRYTLLVADIPAERRPASVLAKKLSSLNANTTGRRESPGVNISHACDFMNRYGDWVAIELMHEYERINAAMAFPVKEENQPNAIARVTGRAVFLPIEKQEWLYEALTSKYYELLENEQISGGINLKVQSINGRLLGEPIQSTPPLYPQEKFRTPFIDGIYIQPIELNYIFKPYQKKEILGFLAAESPEQALSLGVDNSTCLKQQLMERLIDFEDNYIFPYTGNDNSSTLFESKKAIWEAQRKYIDSIIDAFPAGQTVALRMGEVSASGIVGKIIPPPITANPSVPSGWKIKVYLTKHCRQISIPFSALAEGKSDRKFTLTKIDDPKIWDLFDNKDLEISKEQREICYGNLLMACKRFFFGEIVEFFDYQGKLRYGLLVHRLTDAAKKLENDPVRIPNSDSAIAFFSKTNYRGKLLSADNHLKVFMDRTYTDGNPYLTLEVPLSRKTGGRYYLDTSLLEAAGTEFESWGRKMSMTLYNKSQIKRVLEVLSNIGVFAYNYLNEAKQVLI